MVKIPHVAFPPSLSAIDRTLPSMSQPQISIIGAGLSGLVLGRCLLQHGISSVLFDQGVARSGSTRHGYGITLHPWAYKPLLKYLDLDEGTFRKRLAVDAAVGGVGRIESNSSPVAEDTDVSSFRANRQRLENMLSEGLSVRWEHDLANVKSEDSSNTLEFRNGQQLQSAIVVGAEGPHSQVRKFISPSTDFNVLPFAVYNGKRRLILETFDEKYASDMDGATVIERRKGQTLLQITVNDRTSQSVSISYTYSRPAHHPDPIFNPDRPASGARDIPAEFFNEIAGLEDLQGPFKEVFDVDKMHGDRLLNWLMRSVLVSVPELKGAADHGIVLMGDSVHAGPILGGYGANAAIKDGVELAEYIIEHGTKSLAGFYESRYETWRQYVESSEAQLGQMHDKARPNL